MFLYKFVWGVILILTKGDLNLQEHLLRLFFTLLFLYIRYTILLI